MLIWFQNNLSTILICIVLMMAISGIILSMVKKRKSGISSCGCSCGSCPMSGKCHK